MTKKLVYIKNTWKSNFILFPLYIQRALIRLFEQNIYALNPNISKDKIKSKRNEERNSAYSFVTNQICLFWIKKLLLIHVGMLCLCRIQAQIYPILYMDTNIEICMYIGLNEKAARRNIWYYFLSEKVVL